MQININMMFARYSYINIKEFISMTTELVFSLVNDIILADFMMHESN
jgi:hypothetical protein